MEVIRYWQGMGKPVLVDLDDAYHILPWSNPAHRFWIENNDKEALDWLEKGLRQVDGLTSPNRLLLQDWSHVVKGYYLPNFARGEWWRDLPDREKAKAQRGLQDRIVIGWGGSVSHYDSWWGSGLREAANIISHQHPEVIWMICGNDPRIYDQLPVPADCKYHQVGVPPNEWPKVVKTFDIGVAPLFGPYDQRRSWIKGMEYLLGGVPWVGTVGEPYRDLLGLGVQVKNSVDNWLHYLSLMIQDLEAEQRIAAQRIPIAQQWLIENQLGTYEQIYKDVLSQFQTRRTPVPGLYVVKHKIAA